MHLVNTTLCAGIAAFFLAGHADAVEIGPGDDLEAAVRALVPGEELVLRGGVYSFDENITLTANGTTSQPIVIRAKAGEFPVFTQATSNHNVVEINGSSYLVLQGIEFTGGSHGVRLMNSDFITIESCEFQETGDVAISANSGGTYEGLRLLRNHIHHTNGTGEGMYLGCNNDACRIANSLIEGNYIHHTNRATVEQGDGIEIKEGSYGNIVRNNVIHDTKYPGIILYGVRGNGAPNVVEGNAVWNVADNTVQIAADAVVRNNIVLGNVAFQAHQASSPSNIEFVHNTVINSGAAVEVRNVSGPVLLANNAVYSQAQAIRLISGSLGQVTLAGNVGVGGLSGGNAGYVEGNGLSVDMIGANYNGSPPVDVFPAPDGALNGAGSAAHVTALDFNGNERNGVADVGAYAFSQSGNAGWILSEGFKLSSTEGKTPRAPANLQAN
ncbi:MAG: right-handed parallel beta-helix repeat-containing protein [Gammaproteobacteria bacterium]|nr:right-handed parallel beta-helix repeat-containing protein [Gammaproteobacteria bacterium]